MSVFLCRFPPHAVYRSACFSDITVACVYRNNSRKAVGARHTHCFGRVRCQWSCPFPADSPPHMCNSQNPPLSLCWSGLWSFSCGRQHLHSWVRGLVARRKQQQVDRARQTTAPWQRASCFYRVTSSLNLGHLWGRKHPRIEKKNDGMDVFQAAATVNRVNLLFREFFKV